jgi:hypothetical protein
MTRCETRRERQKRKAGEDEEIFLNLEPERHIMYWNLLLHLSLLVGT